MAAGPFTFYDVISQDLAEGVHKFSTGTYKLSLHTSTYVPSNSHTAFGSVNGEVGAGLGYTVGGHTLSVTEARAGVTTSITPGTVKITGAGAGFTAKYGVVRADKGTPATDPIIGYFLLDSTGANVTIASGQSVTFSWTAELLKVTSL